MNSLLTLFAQDKIGWNQPHKRLKSVFQLRFLAVRFEVLKFFTYYSKANTMFQCYFINLQ